MRRAADSHRRRRTACVTSQALCSRPCCENLPINIIWVVKDCSSDASSCFIKLTGSSCHKACTAALHRPHCRRGSRSVHMPHHLMCMGSAPAGLLAAGHMDGQSSAGCHTQPAEEQQERQQAAAPVHSWLRALVAVGRMRQGRGWRPDQQHTPVPGPMVHGEHSPPGPVLLLRLGQHTWGWQPAVCRTQQPQRWAQRHTQPSARQRCRATPAAGRLYKRLCRRRWCMPG